ncbi:MAG TPA: DUF2269 family protein [Candidatus Eisenbacteria bacterium]
MRQALVFLHVAGGVLLIGELLFASLWLRSAMSRGGSPAILRYTLATMTWTSKSVALPAILVNLIAGLALLHFAGVHLGGAIWVWLSLALYVVLSGLWHGVLIPTRKRMLARMEEAAGSAGGGGTGAGAAGAIPEETLAMARRWISVSGAVLALLFAILLLMTWKPAL